MTPEEQFDADMAEWQLIRAWMPIAKAREMELRISLAARAFNNIKGPSGAYPEGSHTQVVGGARANWRLDMKPEVKRVILIELLSPTLQEAALTPEQAAGLIRGRPELGMRAYNALPPDKRAIVDKMLETKPGRIELEATELPK